MSLFRAGILVALAVLLGAVHVDGARVQHAYTAEEVAMGGRLFQGNCATCHGATGDAIGGADLTSGTFRRAADDEEFISVVRTGIAGTSMPPNDVTTEEAGLILAYLRSLAGIDVAAVSTDTLGDPVAGRALFETSGCMNCHRVNGEGGWSGPDLGRVGAAPQDGGRGLVPPAPEEIRQRLEIALTDPNAEVRRENQTFRVTTTAGTVSGRLLNRDTHTVSILVDGTDIRTFSLDELEEYGVAPSPMPSFEGRLAPGEIVDLVSYLTTLR